MKKVLKRVKLEKPETVGVKAVNHKFLIRALVGGASIRDDIVIVTPASTPEKLRVKKMKDLPRMLKFSVGRGIRVAYEPMLDPKTGDVLKLDGKQVYKEIDSKESKYETIIEEIYKLAFRQLKGNESDIKDFGSFVGVLELMKKHLDKRQIDETHKRYIDLLWGTKGQRAQELEVGDPQADFQIKSAGYQRFVKELGVKDMSDQYVEKYYENYGQRGKVRETFRDYLNYLRDGIWS